MEETISLKEIFEVIKKRLLLITAFVLGAALVAAIISFFVLTKEYQSDSQFIVNQSEKDQQVPYDVNSIRTNVEIINTYNQIITSNAILDDVAKKENLPYSADTLKGKIQVSSEQGSQVVTVSATDPDPAVAVEIVNATVETFEEKIPKIMNVDNVSILTKAELKENPSPIAPKPMLNIAIAIVLGLVVGIGVAFLIEYLDTSITTEVELEKLGLPILGVIPTLEESDLKAMQMSSQQSRLKRGGFHSA